MRVARNIKKLLGVAKTVESPEAAALRRRVEGLEAENARLRSEKTPGKRGGTLNPSNLVWIFGAGRSGSTWLARMMQEVEGHEVWFEPHVGDLFDPVHLRTERRRGGKQFILGDRYRDTWLPLVRRFVTDGAQARFPEIGPYDYLVVKEPSGSAAAPLLMEALPESRLVLLIRDPRDVVASWKEAFNSGGWAAESVLGGDRRERDLSERQLNNLARDTSGKYISNVGNAYQAYRAHEGYKALLRYEDLLEDPLREMSRMCSELELPVGREELARVVEKHSWKNVPADEKGEGKFYRKASPGSWRQDLTQRQIELVEKQTAPILEEFYPD